MHVIFLVCVFIWVFALTADNKMDKASVLYLVLGLIVAAVVSALVVTLLPAAGAGSYYIYETNENGIIRWFRKSPKQEILTIKSSLLEKTYGVAQSDEENLECGQARFDIQEIFQTSGSNDKVRIQVHW